MVKKNMQKKRDQIGITFEMQKQLEYTKVNLCFTRVLGSLNCVLFKQRLFCGSINCGDFFLTIFIKFVWIANEDPWKCNTSLLTQHCLERFSLT